jgi:hypothetical protein
MRKNRTAKGGNDAKGGGGGDVFVAKRTHSVQYNCFATAFHLAHRCIIEKIKKKEKKNPCIC